MRPNIHCAKACELLGTSLNKVDLSTGSGGSVSLSSASSSSSSQTSNSGSDSDPESSACTYSNYNTNYVHKPASPITNYLFIHRMHVLNKRGVTPKFCAHLLNTLALQKSCRCHRINQCQAYIINYHYHMPTVLDNSIPIENVHCLIHFLLC